MNFKRRNKNIRQDVGYPYHYGHSSTAPTLLHSQAAIVDKSPFPLPSDSQHLAVLYKQLVISLKFHHAQSLAQLPRDLALQAMNEVWESCNSKPVRKDDRS